MIILNMMMVMSILNIHGTYRRMRNHFQSNNLFHPQFPHQTQHPTHNHTHYQTSTPMSIIPTTIPTTSLPTQTITIPIQPVTIHHTKVDNTNFLATLNNATQTQIQTTNYHLFTITISIYAVNKKPLQEAQS